MLINADAFCSVRTPKSFRNATQTMPDAKTGTAAALFPGQGLVSLSTQSQALHSLVAEFLFGAKKLKVIFSSSSMRML